MATYKVIQDIEAEDKLVGPFSFRQFVYLLIGAFFGYLNFVMIAKHLPFMLFFFLPPMAFCFFFAWPWSPDQPTEVWALARIRFLFKPRKRIWDQSGIKEFVTITVPKRIERVYTDGLSQTEVRSRLEALASTIDSRGWAVKNVNINEATQAMQPVGATDRLVDFSNMPQEVSNVDVRPDDDILDEINNPAAAQMNQMIDASEKAHRQSLIDRLKSTPSGPEAAIPTTAAATWFTSPAQPVAPAAVPVMPVDDMMLPPADSDNQPLPSPATQRRLANTHLKTVPTNPIVDQAAPGFAQPVMPMPAQQPIPAPAPPEPTAPPPNPAILNLARDNNLDVATIAREAKRTGTMEASDGEVEISLR